MTLLTGITGFLGGALAARLLSRGATVAAVVRAPSLECARGRVARSLSRFGQEAEGLAPSVQVVLGDLAEPETYEASAFDVATHVVHAAACTSFASTREAHRSNVVGTQLLAQRIRRAPRLSRFLHVSTAYCCGDQPNRIVREEDSPRDEHGYVNEYSRSKAEAERFMLSLKGTIPLVIARPSVVIGHTELGIAPSPSLFWYYRALAGLGAGPFGLQCRRDIVPVDWVASGLDFLLHLERPRFRTYHLSAGAGAVTVEEILRCFAAPRRWRMVSPDELAAMLHDVSQLVGSEHEARALVRGLAACARFGWLGVDWFANDRLTSEGFQAPPRFSEYLPRCIQTSGARSIHDQMVDEV
jgi:nucleoside-diphosphate-sugar epimerase